MQQSVIEKVYFTKGKYDKFKSEKRRQNLKQMHKVGIRRAVVYVRPCVYTAVSEIILLELQNLHKNAQTP